MTDKVEKQLSATPPLSDLAEFSGLSGPETQLVIATRIDEYHQQIVQINERILTFKSIHNAVTPIHAKLPSEILIHIFRHVEPDCCQHIQLSHVCRLWRSAIHQTPEFWVDILSAIPVIDRPHGRQLFKSFFKRTMSLPFGVLLKSRELTTIQELSNSHRLTSLSITFDHDYHFEHDLLNLIDMELLHLRRLKCDYVGSTGFGDVPLRTRIRDTPASDRLPNLRILNVHGQCITFAFIVPSLCDLRIFGPLAMISPDFILDALRGCPNLENLTVESVRNPSPAEAPQMDVGPPIPLAKLRQLTLASVSGKLFVRLFLPRLKYPPTTQIHITGFATHLSYFLCHLSPPTPTPAASTIQSLVATISATDHSDSHLEVKGSSDLALCRLSMSLCYPLLTDERNHCHMDPFLDISTVFSSFNACDLTHLTFNLERGISVSYENWNVALVSLSQIRHFAVRIASCRNLLRVLRKEELLPQLLSLSITCENGSGVHESLVLAIESRAAMNVSPLDQLRFYTQQVARRRAVIAVLAFSMARLERLKAYVRDVYTGRNDDVQ